MSDEKRYEEKKAFILIDYTDDFVADEGKLSVGKPAQALEKSITEKIESYFSNSDFIITVNDFHEIHDKNHPEHKLFPPHNLKGSEGRRLYGNIETLITQMETKKPSFIHRMDKRRYSAFCGTALEMLLRQEGVNKIELAGVCTDICILHTAIEAYHKGFEVVIDEKAVASFNHAAHHMALEHFEKVLGFTVNKG
ncbi:Nicotinamidase-related amidase [Tindallia magadiensis]|uniref:Nicotinamidase-related amidase n=1 Tax=Tindallia magadiensis TaxID=69895 RepID=A0A1I3B6A9_9FIRM|nr:isochorismatase family cysteine hydrolase [Tindallia magadiensis]SFH57750.1 Nicotinamidase-related amidase [Tindallia magadiensis]